MTEPAAKKAEDAKRSADETKKSADATQRKASEAARSTEKKGDSSDKALHKPAQAPKGTEAPDRSKTEQKRDEKSENVPQKAVSSRSDDQKRDKKDRAKGEFAPRIRAEDDPEGPMELNPDGTELLPQKVGGAAPGTKGEKVAASAKEGTSVVEHKDKAPEVAIDPLSEIHDKEGGTADEAWLDSDEVEKNNPQAEEGEIEGQRKAKNDPDLPPTGPDHSISVGENKEKVIAQMQRTYTYGDQGQDKDHPSPKAQSKS